MVYKVVVIEDEPQVAELLGLILRHAEIEVFTALDGKSGLTMIREMLPHLILLDIMMPQMNGWDVFTAVRSDPALKQIPIIIESVLPERPERKVDFANSDIDYYFTKPFDTMRLRREVARMLGRDQLWPPPKPRPARSPLPIRATGEILIEPEQKPATPPTAADSQPPAETKPAQPGPDGTRADTPAPSAPDRPLLAAKTVPDTDKTRVTPTQGSMNSDAVL